MTYLGDGVHVKRDHHGGVVLVTTDGLHVTNRIVLELETLARLLEFLAPEIEHERAS